MSNRTINVVYTVAGGRTYVRTLDIPNPQRFSSLIDLDVAVVNTALEQARESDSEAVAAIVAVFSVTGTYAPRAFVPTTIEREVLR